MIQAIVAAAAALLLTACSDKESDKEEDEPTIWKNSAFVDMAKRQKKAWEEGRPDKTKTQIGPFDCYYEAQGSWASFSEIYQGRPTFSHHPIPEKNQFCEKRLKQVETEVQKLFSEKSLECSLNHYLTRVNGFLGDDMYAHVKLSCLAKR